MSGEERAGLDGGGVATMDSLRSDIARVLDAHFQGRPQTVGVSQRPSSLRSTRPLHEVDAYLDDGRTLRLLLKQVGGGDGSAPGPKSTFRRETGHEAEVYRAVLPRGRFGVPTFYGAWSDETGAAWLLMEHVTAVPLHEAAVSDWLRVASWLGEVHARFSRSNGALTGTGIRIIDGQHLERWLERALWFRVAGPDAGRMWRLVAGVRALEPDLPRRLLALPRTLIHGEFYPANILVRTEGPVRVCPVDWETAAVGPGLLDLAALVTGWDVAHRSELTEAYQRGWCGAGGRAALPGAELDRGLLHCRLQLALQWLGWEQDWTPPPEQAHDWLSESEAIMAELGS